MFAQQRCVQSIHVQKNKPETLFKFTVENMASPKNLSGFSLVTSLRFVEGCLTITCPQEKKKNISSTPPHLTSPFPTCQVVFCGDSGDNFPKSHRNQRMAVDSGPCWQREIHGKKTGGFFWGAKETTLYQLGCYRLEFKNGNIMKKKVQAGDTGVSTA